MQNEWIDIQELVRRARLSDSTIRRLAGLEKGYPRRISFRRRGLGGRAPLVFNWPVVEKQLDRVLGREGVRVSSAEAEAPTLFKVLSQLDELKSMVATLAATVTLAIPSQPAVAVSAKEAVKLP